MITEVIRESKTDKFINRVEYKFNIVIYLWSGTLIMQFLAKIIPLMEHYGWEKGFLWIATILTTALGMGGVVLMWNKP